MNQRPNAESVPPVVGQKCGAICPRCGGCDWLTNADGTEREDGSICVRCGSPAECPMVTVKATQCPHDVCWKAGTCQSATTVTSPEAPMGGE